MHCIFVVVNMYYLTNYTFKRRVLYELIHEKTSHQKEQFKTTLSDFITWHFTFAIEVSLLL